MGIIQQVNQVIVYLAGYPVTILGITKAVSALKQVIFTHGNFPVQEVAVRKYYLLESAYRLGDTQYGNRIASQIDDYLVNLLNYTHAMIQDGRMSADSRDVQLSMSLLNGLVDMTKDF